MSMSVDITPISAITHARIPTKVAMMPTVRERFDGVLLGVGTTVLSLSGN